MGRNILIVEDSKTLLETIKYKLEKRGYHVEKAENALEALSVVEHKKIDLIISDIMMPNISGLSMVSILNEFNLDRIPVIIISSLHTSTIRMSAMELGVYDFIIKPINFKQLCAKISFLLNRNDPSKLK